VSRSVFDQNSLGTVGVSFIIQIGAKEEFMGCNAEMSIRGRIEDCAAEEWWARDMVAKE
jgi:hypothetical protein